MGVDAIHLIPSAVVRAQIEAVAGDIGVDAVKIGMLGSPTVAETVADWLEQVDVPVVFDPVMVATSGARLAEAATIAGFERLMGLASIVTPNLLELQALGGRDAVLRYGCHLAEKGGHGDAAMLVDRLWAPDGTLLASVEAPRLDTNATHGTGCTFASALATALGQGHSMADAFSAAVRFVRLAIQAAPGLGGGHGPMGQQFVRNFPGIA